MSILVTGSTGTIGSQVVAQLAKHGADVLAFARDLDKGRFPDGVKAAKGDLMNVESVRAALAHERAEQDRLRRTDDFREGVQAMSERREPRFVGR